MAARLPDEDARERVRTDLDRNFLVEAGAGTGKTRLLVDRIENLIASGRARLRHVVAITFTESAAAELRVAIRRRIETRRRARDGAVRERFLRAREDLEIASVSTIHAFAADLLRERPVEARVDPGFDVADELTASLLRTRAWDRWMEAQRDAAPDVLRRAIELGLSLAHLREAGDVLLRYRDVVTGSIDPGPEPEDPIEWLRRAEPHMRGCIAAVGRDCLDHDDKAVGDLQELGRVLETIAHLTPAEIRRHVLGSLKCRIGGRQGNWRPGTLRAIKARLAGLTDDLEALRAAHGHWLASGVVDWLGGYGTEYQALKAELGVLDFDDLLLLARNLLRDDRNVRRDLQTRYQAILVDEFQDTDPLQVEIVFFLAEDHPEAAAWDQVMLRAGKLFIVGDPKQSIYAFRRADIETYERVKGVLAVSGATEYITANFRSVKEILDGVNATFEGAMKAPGDGAYQPDYVALAPSTQTRSTGDSPALVLLYPHMAGADDLDMATLREAEAEALAAYLRHGVDSGLWTIGADRRRAGFGDVALLFRGMSDVPVYEAALARYQIPYRVTSSRTFYVREEVGWLINVLTAIEHPTDPVAVWGALRSPLLGCSDREIYVHIAAGGVFDYRLEIPRAVDDAAASGRPGRGVDGVAAAFAILRELHEARNGWSVPRLVEEVLTRTQARTTFLLTPQGHQRVSNLNKIVTLARALEESGLLSLRAFVRWLRDMEHQAVDEAEPPTVEPGDDIVRVMSIHAAKGLEFPIVVVPDLGRGPGGGPEHLLVDRVRGSFGTQIGRVGAHFLIQTRNYEDLKARQEHRDAAERLRLLYVAMTRAKEALVLPVFPKAPRHSMMSDLSRLLPATPKPGRAHNGWMIVDGASLPQARDDRPALRIRPPETSTPAAGRLADTRAAWLRERQQSVAAAGAPEPIRRPSQLVDHTALTALSRHGVRLESDRGGRVVGELVHAVLATLPPHRPDLAEPFVRYFARQRRVTESLARKAISLVRIALESDELRGAGESLARIWREVPFAVSGEGAVEGSIDLLIDRDGAVALADFKTDAVGAGQTERLRQLYMPQLEAYEDALRRAGVVNVAARLVLLGEQDPETV
jgi:ATP-dependent helicase/nuclease subunit A